MYCCRMYSAKEPGAEFPEIDVDEKLVRRFCTDAGISAKVSRPARMIQRPLRARKPPGRADMAVRTTKPRAAATSAPRLCVRKSPRTSTGKEITSGLSALTPMTTRIAFAIICPTGFSCMPKLWIGQITATAVQAST
jgi:hypothetical protein